MNDQNSDSDELLSQWTTEVRKGVFQLLVLSIINQKPVHGFEIVKKIRMASKGLIDLPGGTIYPLLNRMERKGLIRVVIWEYNGRKRKTYAITEIGADILSKSHHYWDKLVLLVDQFSGS